jgi:hypothetical protein
MTDACAIFRRQSGLLPPGSPHRHGHCVLDTMISHALARAGLQSGWDPSAEAYFSHAYARSPPPWNWHISYVWTLVLKLRSARLEHGASRDQTGLKIAPQRHQELAGERHDGDAARLRALSVDHKLPSRGNDPSRPSFPLRSSRTKTKQRQGYVCASGPHRRYRRIVYSSGYRGGSGAARSRCRSR